MNNSVKYFWQNNSITWLYLLGIVLLGASATRGIILGSPPLAASEIAEAFTK